MGNKFNELGEKNWADITRVMKSISESIKSFYKQATTDGAVKDGDLSLMAMQILSILCGFQRGYSKEKIGQMWAASLNEATKIHESRNSDRVVSKFQAPLGWEGQGKQ